MRKPLFIDDSYNADGSLLADQVREAMDSLIADYFNCGYDAAHIEQVICEAVSQMCIFKTAKRIISERQVQRGSD